jgi:DedD protein
VVQAGGGAPAHSSAAATHAGPDAGAAKAAPAHAGYAVQLAAFSDDKGANALAGRLRRAGYSAYTEPLKTSKGTLWRVRVGPYGSRESATAARDRLKAEGQNGIVASAR